MYSKLRRVATLVALPLALAACGDTTGPGAFDGTYNLATVNGQAIPLVVASEADQGITIGFRIDGGRVVLDRNNFDSRLIFSTLVNTQVFTTDTISGIGTYTVSGSTITFRSSDPTDPAFDATIQGDQITLVEVDEDFGALTLIFRK